MNYPLMKYLDHSFMRIIFYENIYPYNFVGIKLLLLHYISKILLIKILELINHRRMSTIATSW